MIAPRLMLFARVIVTASQTTEPVMRQVFAKSLSVSQTKSVEMRECSVKAVNVFVMRVCIPRMRQQLIARIRSVIQTKIAVAVMATLFA